MLHDHSFWMTKAINKAKQGKTPFGAVIVNKNGHYIQAYNTTGIDGPTAHAETNAIQKLKCLDFKEPHTLTLYSTIEPCPMCMSAVVWAGIGNVVYGASIDDASEFGQQINISCKEVARKSWYHIKVIADVERENCLELLKK